MEKLTAEEWNWSSQLDVLWASERSGHLLWALLLDSHPSQHQLSTQRRLLWVWISKWYAERLTAIGLKVESFQMKFVHIDIIHNDVLKSFLDVFRMSHFLIKAQPPVRVTTRSMVQAEAWKRMRWRPVMTCNLDMWYVWSWCISYPISNVELLFSPDEGSQRKYWGHAFLECKYKVQPSELSTNIERVKDYLRSYRPQRHAQRKVTPGV